MYELHFIPICAIMLPMILPGHLAAGYLAARYTRSDPRAALAAGIFPDVVDKTARYVLHISPSGRLPAHSIFFGIFSTLVVGALTCRRQVVRGWAAGYATHLLSDVSSDLLNAGDQFGYLIWPLVPAPAPRYRTLFSSILAYSVWAHVLEVAASVWALAVWRKD